MKLIIPVYDNKLNAEGFNKTPTYAYLIPRPLMQKPAVLFPGAPLYRPKQNYQTDKEMGIAAVLTSQIQLLALNLFVENGIQVYIMRWISFIYFSVYGTSIMILRSHSPGCSNWRVVTSVGHVRQLHVRREPLQGIKGLSEVNTHNASIRSKRTECLFKRNHTGVHLCAYQHTSVSK